MCCNVFTYRSTSQLRVYLRIRKGYILCMAYNAVNTYLSGFVEIRCKLKTNVILGKVLGLYPGTCLNKNI